MDMERALKETYPEKHAKVALVRCGSYDRDEVKSAIKEAFDLLGGVEEATGLAADSRMLIKPNLLAKAAPEKACTTHPEVFRAVCEILQDEGYGDLVYGDSHGNPMISLEKVAETCGLKKEAEALGIPLGDFEHGTVVEFKEGRVAHDFTICDEVLRADGIVNVCKMKTHQLERITGAVKNTFGCVFGINKGASHAKFATAEVFAKMIADLNRLVSPVIHVMDGVVAMEGNGPQSGSPRSMNVILISKDPVALDAVFCSLIDLDPKLVPTNVSGMEQEIGTYEDIEVVTPEGSFTTEEIADMYGEPSFDVQRSTGYRGMLRPIRFLAPLLEKKPVVIKSKCIGCGICVEACPVDGKAIHVDAAGGAGRSASKGRGGKAVYDYSKCIKCYCCQEMCPEGAIDVKKSLIAKIADRSWRM